MENDYDFSALLYDPVLFLVLKPIRIAVMQELLKHKEKLILDLCCGTGNQLKLLSKNGFKNLHCLDLSEPMLKRAKTDACPMKIYNEDATKTSFENESFDIIIISFAIHEKDRNMQRNLLAEAYRLLKKDGLILIVDFAFDDKTRKFAKIGIKMIERMAGKEHYNNFKSYIKNSGLPNIVEQDRFKLIKSVRKAMKSLPTFAEAQATMHKANKQIKNKEGMFNDGQNES